MKKVMVTASCVAVLMTAMCGFGALVGNAVDSEAWITQDLTDSRPNFSNSEDSLTVEFARRGSGIPSPVAAGLGADVSVMAGVVVGDYSDVEGLSFRVTRSGAVMVEVSVRLKGSNGVEWNYRATTQLSQHDNEECIVNVPLDPSLWSYQGKKADSSARWHNGWLASLADVEMVRLVLEHKSFDADSISVSDFRVVGDGFISDPVALQAVNQHFGANAANIDQLTEKQRTHDSDRDGRTDVSQILAGEDPGLAVEIVEVDEQGRARLRWDGVAGRRYRVERSRDLTDAQAFDKVPIENSVAERFGKIERTDQSPVSGPGPYFYRVIKE